MPRSVFGALVALAVVSGCTRFVTAPLPSQPISASFRGQVINWTSGEQVTFAVKAFDHQGSLAVCGAWAESPGGDAQSGEFNSWLVNSMRIEVDGQTIANDISWFAKGSYEKDNPPIGSAACRATDLPWQRSYGRTVSLEASRTNFKLYD